MAFLNNINQTKTFLFLITSFFIISCYKDNGDNLIKEEVIKDVSYSKDILSILNTSCNSCHSTSQNQGGVILDNYTEVLKYVNNGSLYGSIIHDGFSPMPKGSSKLSENTINKFDLWIKEGAKNN